MAALMRRSCAVEKVRILTDGESDLDCGTHFSRISPAWSTMTFVRRHKEAFPR